MARPMQTMKTGKTAGRHAQASNNVADTARRHEHRTAKIVELIGTSTKSFEDAARGAIKDASATTRGITGASVEGFSVKCVDGKITEYKASLKVVFGIERT
jgi:flavin-binding protein dodecin